MAGHLPLRRLAGVLKLGQEIQTENEVAGHGG